MTTILNNTMFDPEDAARSGITGEFVVPLATPLPPTLESPLPAGPLPPPERKYLRPSAYWADRWLSVRRP